jgi:hypothetical protein
MKRILLPLTLVLAVSAQAQVTNNPKAKVDPKNNKVSNPVVEKPKPKLMSREQLRKCIDMDDANAQAGENLKKEQNDYTSTAEQLKAEKAQLDQEEATLLKQDADLKAERDAIMKMNEELVAAAPKLDKKEFEARNTAYKARADAFGTSIEARNVSAKAFLPKRKVFGEKVDALDAKFKAIDESRDALLDAKDLYKAECLNKAYDENDLKFVKEQKAAGK